MMSFQLGSKKALPAVVKSTIGRAYINFDFNNIWVILNHWC